MSGKPTYQDLAAWLADNFRVADDQGLGSFCSALRCLSRANRMVTGISLTSATWASCGALHNGYDVCGCHTISKSVELPHSEPEGPYGGREKRRADRSPP